MPSQLHPANSQQAGARRAWLDSALTWVCAMMRMTWQYFFMEAKSFSSCFLPSSSCHFLQYLVKAFFLDLYLRGPGGCAEGEGGECKQRGRRVLGAAPS